MTKGCAVAGCSRQVAVYSSLCQRCKKRDQDNGDALQRPVSKSVLRPLIRELHSAIFKRDADGNVETAVREQHARILSIVEGVVYEAAHGYRVGIYASRAAADLARGLQQSDPMQFALVVAAMYLLRLRAPTTFRSDRAFYFQLVKRVRQRAWFGSGTFWRNDQYGGKRSWMPRARVRHVLALAEYLHVAFGRWNAHACRVVEQERTRQPTTKAGLDAAFATLRPPRRKLNQAFWRDGGTAGRWWKAASPEEKAVRIRNAATAARRAMKRDRKTNKLIAS